MVSYWRDASGLMIVNHQGCIRITACCDLPPETLHSLVIADVTPFKSPISPDFLHYLEAMKAVENANIPDAKSALSKLCPHYLPPWPFEFMQRCVRASTATTVEYVSSPSLICSLSGPAAKQERILLLAVRPDLSQWSPEWRRFRGVTSPCIHLGAE